MTGDRVEETLGTKKKAAPSLAVFAAAAVLPRHGSWKSTPKISVDFNARKPGCSTAAEHLHANHRKTEETPSLLPKRNEAVHPRPAFT
jgi:hypothetical protein